MKNILKRVLRIIFSIILLTILFISIDFKEIILKLKGSDIKYLFFPAIIYFIGLFLSAKKWKKILNFYGVNVSTKKLFNLYVIGSFYNNFLPSTVGGDGYKFIKLNKEYPSKKKEILSSILIERGFGFLVWYAINLILSIVFFNEIFNNKFLLILESLLILSPIFLYLFLRSFKFISIKSKFINKLHSLFCTISNISKNYNVSIYSFFISLLINLLSIFSIYFIFLSLDVKISLLIISFCMSLIVIYSVIPISFNNIGFTEGLSLILFAIFNIENSTILLTFLIARFISVLLSISGVVILIYESVKK